MPDSNLEAQQDVQAMMVEKVFGEVADEIVIESRLFGHELSLTLITDGFEYRLFPPGQDAKRILDGNLGSNTGGMGVYASTPLVSNFIRNAFGDDVIRTRNNHVDSELLALFDEPRKVEHVMVNVADAWLHQRRAAIARHDEHAVLVSQFPHQRMFSGTLANDKNAHDGHKRIDCEENRVSRESGVKRIECESSVNAQRMA